MGYHADRSAHPGLEWNHGMGIDVGGLLLFMIIRIPLEVISKNNTQDQFQELWTNFESAFFRKVLSKSVKGNYHCRKTYRGYEKLVYDYEIKKLSELSELIDNSVDKIIENLNILRTVTLYSHAKTLSKFIYDYMNNKEKSVCNLGILLKPVSFLKKYMPDNILDPISRELRSITTLIKPKPTSHPPVDQKKLILDSLQM